MQKALLSYFSKDLKTSLLFGGFSTDLMSLVEKATLRWFAVTTFHVDKMGTDFDDLDRKSTLKIVHKLGHVQMEEKEKCQNANFWWAQVPTNYFENMSGRVSVCVCVCVWLAKYVPRAESGPLRSFIWVVLSTLSWRNSCEIQFLILVCLKVWPEGPK